MTADKLDRVKSALREFGCGFTENAALSSCTTFGIGGVCPILADISGEEAACGLLSLMNRENIPFYIIGKGSNLLADDGMIDMVFLRTGKAFSRISEENGIIKCQAGAALRAVSVFAEERGLTGLEFAYGIPGNIGGAVFMNAGAYGGEMKDVVFEVRAADFSGNVRVFSGSELDFGYRHSVFSEGKYMILSASLKLIEGSREEISAKMAELTDRRREKQPLEYRSAGSTFKRPAGAYAAALIEQCGLKGYSCGDARVSEKHSGFVVNTGEATFKDVMNVIEHVKRTVFEKTGIMLECEPEIILSGESTFS